MKSRWKRFKVRIRTAKDVLFTSNFVYVDHKRTVSITQNMGNLAQLFHHFSHKFVGTLLTEEARALKIPISHNGPINLDQLVDAIQKKQPQLTEKDQKKFK